MQIFPQGKITVTAAGTPVQCPALPAGNGNGNVARIFFAADPAMAGTTSYVKATAAKLTVKAMPKPASGYADSLEVCADDNMINPQDYWIDAATSADGVFVTYWVE